MIQMMNMKVQKIITGIIVAFIVIELGWFFGGRLNIFHKQDSSYIITGQVVQVNSNSVVVQGTVNDPVANEYKARVINFTVTSATVFTKTLYTADLSAQKPGVPFTPQKKDMPGSFSDLKPKMQVVRLESDRDLFTSNTAVIKSINYSVYDFTPAKTSR